MLNVDITKLRTASKRKIQEIDNCAVLDAGSGDFPREIEVRPPGDDGPRMLAINNSLPGLTTSDTVLISVDNSKEIARVKGYGTDTAGPTSSLVNAPTLIVNNGSGSAASANDVGYIDENGDYQTTTTANLDAAWCVVIQGGANGADIYVARRGRVTVAYAGSAPSDGDYLVTSTTAGSASAQATMSPEVFAICQAAGSGGTVSALMLASRPTVPRNSGFNTFEVASADLSDFVATIAAAGVSGDKVYYNAPSSGSAAAITPVSSNDLLKIILHNTTQTEEARIIALGSDGGGNFIQVSDSADVSAWVSTDAITTRSQTNTTTVTSSYFFDLEAAETGSPASAMPVLTSMLWTQIFKFVDTGSTETRMLIHPFETNATAKRQNYITSTTTNTAGRPATIAMIPLKQRRFCLLWNASGAGTMNIVFRVVATTEAAP